MRMKEKALVRKHVSKLLTGRVHVVISGTYSLPLIAIVSHDVALWPGQPQHCAVCPVMSSPPSQLIVQSPCAGLAVSAAGPGEDADAESLRSSAEGHSSLDRDTSVLSSTLACERHKLKPHS